MLRRGKFSAQRNFRVSAASPIMHDAFNDSGDFNNGFLIRRWKRGLYGLIKGAAPRASRISFALQDYRCSVIGDRLPWRPFQRGARPLSSLRATGSGTPRRKLKIADIAECGRLAGGRGKESTGAEESRDEVDSLDGTRRELRSKVAERTRIEIALCRGRSGRTRCFYSPVRPC